MLNLAKAAYVIRSLIQDPDLDIKFSGNKICFTIYDCKIETDGTYFKSVVKDNFIDINIKTPDELYQYVLVQVTKNEGFLKYATETVTLDEISVKDYNHIIRLCNNELHVTPIEVLNQIMFTHGTPVEVSSKIGVASKFIKKLRSQSRHKILANAIINGNDQYLKSLGEIQI